MAGQHPMSSRTYRERSVIKTVFDERKRKRNIYGWQASGGRTWLEVVMKKETIRVGMKVCSIYHPERVFTLDRSLIPVRIYHEKGSKRWWTALELRSRSKQARKLSAKAHKQALTSRSLAFQSLPPGILPHSTTIFDRTCLYCGTEFTTKRKTTKFCKGTCRTKFWRERNEIPEIPAKDRLRSEGVV